MTRLLKRSYVLRPLFLTALIVWFAVGPAIHSANPASREQRLSWIILVPKDFKGWTCIDFGVSGAAPLTREGDVLIVRAKTGEILETSTKHDDISFTPEIMSEINGKRQRLPNDVALRMTSSFASPNHSAERDCALVGTVDDADAAGDAPGSDNFLHAPQPLPTEERQALVALYNASGGDQWKHHFGWLGPAGTECKWHGVICHTGIDNIPTVVHLDLGENNLSGSIPKDVAALKNLESFEIFNNHLAGRIPEPMIQRWLDDSLQVSAEANLLTNVTEIKFESRLVWPGCHYRQITFRSDGVAMSLEEHCGTDADGNRSTSCEKKEGEVRAETFAKLGWLIEKDGFYNLDSDYSRTISDSVNEITQVTRDGKTYSVQNYAASGPFKLWAIQRAIEGTEPSVYWRKTTTIPVCR